MSGPEDVLSGRKVLVVEDDALLAMELAEELEAIGAVPIGPAMTVVSALNIVHNEKRIDAALMNVNLRGEVSFPVADALAKRGVPFLFVTGNDQFVSERFPGIPRHPKPAQMPMLIKALSDLIATACQAECQPGQVPR